MKVADQKLVVTLVNPLPAGTRIEVQLTTCRGEGIIDRFVQSSTEYPFPHYMVRFTGRDDLLRVDEMRVERASATDETRIQALITKYERSVNAEMLSADLWDLVTWARDDEAELAMHDVRTIEARGYEARPRHVASEVVTDVKDEVEEVIRERRKDRWAATNKLLLARSAKKAR